MTWEEIVKGELGKPFLWNGRGDDAYDCWGLVMRVYRLLGRPGLVSWSWADEGKGAVAEVLEGEFGSPQWHRTDSPVPGDVATLSGNGRPHHVGVVTPFGILHTTKRHGAVVAKESALKAVGYKMIEYYSWVA